MGDTCKGPGDHERHPGAGEKRALRSQTRFQVPVPPLSVTSLSLSFFHCQVAPAWRSLEEAEITQPVGFAQGWPGVDTSICETHASHLVPCSSDEETEAERRNGLPKATWRISGISGLESWTREQ